MIPPRSGQAVDWPAIRARISEAAVEEALNPSGDRAKQILDARAHALARTLAEERPVGESIEAIIFALANERYAVETRYVREVTRFVDFTTVPGAQDFVVGVTNLRGGVLVVFDLRKILGIPAPGLTDLSRVIVHGRERAEFGILADAVHEIRILSAADLLTPADSVGTDRRYLRGVTVDALVMLDGSALLDDERLYVGGTGTSG